MARDDSEDFEDEDDLSSDDDDDNEEGPEVGVTVEIVGLSLYTHHGVTAAEREIGQRLVLDVRFDVGEPDALITDRVEDTVDYGEVCQVIALIAQQRSYKTLERLCAVIAERYLFRLFRTKRDLFLACADRANERVEAAFRRAAAGAPEGERLQAMGR